jgi:hypothetical protein
MNQDNAYGQQNDSNTLPPIQGQSVAPIAVAAQSTANPAAQNSTTIAVEQAKQLVQQYGANPYQLQGVLQQLKSQYVSEQYHVSIKTTEG